MHKHNLKKHIRALNNKFSKHSDKFFKHSKLALAVFVTVHAIGHGLTQEARAESNNHATLDKASSAYLYQAQEDVDLYVSEDTTLSGFQLTSDVANPGDIVFENGAVLFLDGYTNHDSTGMGLSVDRNSHLVVRGDGIFRAKAYNTSPYSDQKESAIWVSPFVNLLNGSDPAWLDIQGVSLELQGDKGIRVDDGALFTLDNTDNAAGHVYIGIELSTIDQGLTASTEQMSNGISVNNGNSRVIIRTNDLKLYSTGSTDEQTYLINTGDCSSAGSYKAELGALGSSYISLYAADSMELWAFGGDTANSYAVSSRGTSLRNAEIYLSGGSFTLNTDWLDGLTAFGNNPDTGNFAILSLDFANSVVINSAQNALLAKNHGTLSVNGESIEVSGFNADDTVVSRTNYAVSVYANSTITLNAETTLSVTSKDITLLASSGGQMYLKGDVVEVNAFINKGVDTYSYGVWSYGSGSLIQMQADSSLTVFSGSSALDADKSSEIRLIGKDITVQAYSAEGIKSDSYSYGIAARTGSLIDIDATGNLTIDSKNVALMVSGATSEIELSGNTVSLSAFNDADATFGSGYYGIWAYAGTIDMDAESELSLTSKDVAVFIGSNGIVTMDAGNITIKGFDHDNAVLPSTSYYAMTAKAGTLAMNALDTLSIESKLSLINADSTTDSKTNVTTKSMVTLSADTIDLKAFTLGTDDLSTSYYAIRANSGSTVDVTANTKISANADGGTLMLAMTEGTWINMQAPELDLSAANGYLTWAYNKADIRLNYDTENDSFISGHTTKLTGDVLATKGGVASIGLGTKQSVFTGGTMDYSASYSGSSTGVINLYAANGATWNVRQFEGSSNSEVSKYVSTSVDGHGYSSYVNLTEVEGGQDLNIGTLSGESANFHIRTVVDENRSAQVGTDVRDHINIASGSGTHFITIKAIGIANPNVVDWTADIQKDYLIQHYETEGAASLRLDTAENTESVEGDSEGVIAGVENGIAVESAELSDAGVSPLAFVLTNKHQEVDVEATNRKYTLMTRDIVDEEGKTTDENGVKYGTEWYLEYTGTPTVDPEPVPEIPELEPETTPEPEPEREVTEEPEPDPTPVEDADPDCKEDCVAPEEECREGCGSTSVVTPEPIPTTTPLDQDFEHLSTTAQLVTTLAGHGAVYSDWMANLSDLRKRLGEVRYGAQDGLWAKVISQKDSTAGLSGADFEQKLYGLQIGVDHIVTQNEDRLWLLGANFKYSEADQKIKRMDYGRGDMKSYGAFLYAAYADYQGYYTDLVLSVDHYSRKMTAEQTDYSYVNGRFNTWGWGASVESGKMFSFGNDEGWGAWYNHCWVEPQVQLSYYSVKGQNFTMSNGSTVEQKNGQSLVARLGLAIGKKFNFGKKRREVQKEYSQFYVKGGVKHEFLGDQTLRVNGEKFSDKLRGTRVYYGAGMDWNVTDQLRIYAQVERENGHKYKKDYEVSVGLKWQF